MFSGIIETLGTIRMIRLEEANVHFLIDHSFDERLKIGQSIAHNGVCLTVIDLTEEYYTVTAVEETVGRSNLIDLAPGARVNLERSVRPTTYMDGHIVQGHVDTVAVCQNIEGRAGSMLFTFSYDAEYAGLVVDKGSITLNGVSLTLIDPTENRFQVTIVPHTLSHTTFRDMKPGDRVNVEFDIIGKYVQRQNTQEK